MRYVTNPNRRCVYCNGREVLEINEKDEVTNSNLIWNDTITSFTCKDREECRRNVDAENTIISFSGTDKGINKRVITKYGRIISEIELKEGSFGGEKE